MGRTDPTERVIRGIQFCLLLLPAVAFAVVVLGAPIPNSGEDAILFAILAIALGAPSVAYGVPEWVSVLFSQGGRPLYGQRVARGLAWGSLLGAWSSSIFLSLDINQILDYPRVNILGALGGALCGALVGLVQAKAAARAC